LALPLKQTNGGVEREVIRAMELIIVGEIGHNNLQRLVFNDVTIVNFVFQALP
jgi:hypothetical protein